MKKELTTENIRMNLIKEYGTKPAWTGTIMIFAGITVGALCFATGRLPAALFGLIVAGGGVYELLKSNRIKAKINSEELSIREGRCIKKEIRSGASGPKRYFYFTKNSYYTASGQDIRLWEKTHVGDKFYMVSFQDSKKIMKIYPQRVLKYTNK